MSTDWIDVSDTAPRIAYTASASQTAFIVPFVFFEDEDLVVYQNDIIITLAIAYTVAGAEDEAGGSITLLVGATAGDSIVITRDVPVELTTHIPPSGPLDIGGINVQFSKLVAIAQQQQDDRDRALHFPDSDPSSSAELALASTRANKLLGFDGNGELIYPVGPTFVGDTSTGAAVLDSRATASVTSFDVSVNALITCGLTVPGDGGGTTYVRGLVSDPGAFADGGGVYWKVATGVGAANSTGPQGRLTTVSGVAVPTTDQVSVTTVFYAPVPSGVGGLVPIFNGTSMQQYSFLASATDSVGLPLVLGAAWLTNTAYDCFVAINSAAPVLGTGPAWSVSSGATAARGTGAGTTELQLYNGIWTNANAMTLRIANGTTISVPANRATYVGGFMTVAAGETEDSVKKRFVYNAYNQVERPCANAIETTDSWPYTLAAYRQANGNAANQIDIFVGLSGNMLKADVFGMALNSIGNIFTAVGVGVDGINTSNIAQFIGPSTSPSTGRTEMLARYNGYPQIGRHPYAWLEYSTATGVTTWYGDNGQPTLTQCGITGTIFM